MISSKFSNCPPEPTRARDPPTPTASQRGRQSRSGAATANLMRTGNVEAPETITAPRPQKQSGNFSSPTEFYGGPTRPGKMSRGTRRFAGKEQDSVGFALTDEFRMTGGPVPKRSKYTPKNGIANNCAVLQEEKPFRASHRTVHEPKPMDAPYSEDTNPQAPRDPAPHTGKRRSNKHGSVGTNNVVITDAVGDNGNRPASKRTNRSNLSVNVTNLAQYEPKDLNEPEVADRPRGPRHFVPQDMPPRRRPAIHPIKSAASEVHDVLGTGRHGRPEATSPIRASHPSARPTKDALNVFSQVPPSKHDNVANPVERPSLLDHYDPSKDSAADFAPRPSSKRANQSNVESREEYSLDHQGKARGAYANANGQSHGNIFGAQ